MSAARPAVVALAVALAAAAPAAARDVSATELRALAARAEDDPSTLGALRSVTSVDGRPVDVARALGDARPPELRRRLRTLAGTTGAARANGTVARRQAADILAEGRFHESKAPRPFRGALEWLSRYVRRAGHAIGRLLPQVPGGGRAWWGVLGLVVLTAAVLGARRIVDSRVRAAAGRPRAGSTRVDPSRLEREADEAERRGDLERALRLRFRAGLVRLQRADVLPPRHSLTTGEIRRRLRSRDFDSLAAVFDEVVYGRRPARPTDLELSRAAWRQVLAEARP